MKIIVGLGNPGEKYLLNRHNVGFLVLDELAKQLEEDGAEVNWEEDSKHQAFVARIKHKKKDLLLVKPTTYMNNSGIAVQKLMSFYKEPYKNLIVIYDDIDLPLGTVRVRQKGSAGTHNGMRSVLNETGKKVFPRIRLGIESRGVTAPKLQDLASFVLTNFSSKEEKIIAEAIKEAVVTLKSLYK